MHRLTTTKGAAVIWVTLLAYDGQAAASSRFIQLLFLTVLHMESVQVKDRIEKPVDMLAGVNAILL